MEEAHYYNFTAAKAGMEGLDRETINKIIHDASKNSAFYKKQQKKSEEIKQRVELMKAQVKEELSKGPSHCESIELDLSIQQESLDISRDLTETWIHIDMDMFYASVEIRDDPSLADKPVAVGDNSMISTANYIARRFGVRSAMPGFIGKKLCPELVFVPVNGPKYAEEGQKIREIFREYDPNFESHGYDEAHMQVTQVLNERNMNNDEGRQMIAQEIRDRIFQLSRLTASAGIACNKLLAKIATDINKPNGQFYVPPEHQAVKEFMANKQVRKIPGIGKVLEKELNELGILNCQDILTRKLELFFAFSNNTYEFLMCSALGIGRTLHSEGHETPKSCSISKTFPPTTDLGFIEGKLQKFVNRLLGDINEIDVSTKTVTVHISTHKYESYSKAESLKRYVNTFEELHPVAIKLLKTFYPLEPIRLIGLRFSNFIENKLREKTLLSFKSSETVKVENRVEVIHNPVSNQEEKIKCKSCNQTFLSASNLKGHRCNLKRKPSNKEGPKKKIKLFNTLDKFFTKNK